MAAHPAILIAEAGVQCKLYHSKGLSLPSPAPAERVVSEPQFLSPGRQE